MPQGKLGGMGEWEGWVGGERGRGTGGGRAGGGCCPKTPQRKVTRSLYEPARDVARAIAKTQAYEQTRRDRKKVEMLFAHLKRILRLGRLRLRGPRGAQFEFTFAAIAQSLRRLAKLTARSPPLSTPACVA